VASPEDMLGKIPKNTPPWAVGIVSVVVSVGMVFICLYLTSRTEIQAFANSSIKKVEADADLERAATTSMINLVHENSEQITQLSGVLFKTQNENIELTRRVTLIERDLAVANERMASCEERLAKCK